MTIDSQRTTFYTVQMYILIVPTGPLIISKGPTKTPGKCMVWQINSRKFSCFGFETWFYLMIWTLIFLMMKTNCSGSHAFNGVNTTLFDIFHVHVFAKIRFWGLSRPRTERHKAYALLLTCFKYLVYAPQVRRDDPTRVLKWHSFVSVHTFYPLYDFLARSVLQLSCSFITWSSTVPSTCLFLRLELQLSLQHLRFYNWFGTWGWLTDRRSDIVIS